MVIAPVPAVPFIAANAFLRVIASAEPFKETDDRIIVLRKKLAAGKPITRTDALRLLRWIAADPGLLNREVEYPLLAPDWKASATLSYLANAETHDDRWDEQSGSEPGAAVRIAQIELEPDKARVWNSAVCVFSRHCIGRLFHRGPTHAIADHDTVRRVLAEVAANIPPAAFEHPLIGQREVEIITPSGLWIGYAEMVVAREDDGKEARVPMCAMRTYFRRPGRARGIVKRKELQNAEA